MITLNDNNTAIDITMLKKKKKKNCCNIYIQCFTVLRVILM